MKVLMLNTSDSGGGAARAAYRLHSGLRSIGVDSGMLVQSKNGDDPNVIGPPTKFAQFFGMLRPHLDYLPLKLYPRRHRSIFSPAIMPEQLFSRVSGLSPDILHLHWINEGFLRVENLKLFRQPLVWTLHDSWAFTGGCHVPLECNRYRRSCGKCPQLGSLKEYDLSRRVWSRKKKHWDGLNLTVVTPSRWLADCAKSSSLFGNVRVEVIPNGLDLQRYRPFDRRTARNIFGLPQDKKLILFGGVGIASDHNKGFHLLVSALQELAAKGWSEKAELIVFGAAVQDTVPDFGLITHYIGRLHDDISLAVLYAAADVFVMPSIQENLPNTVMESMACGTPCVAFDQGGLPDLIDHEKTGYLARPFEAEDLSAGLAWVLSGENTCRKMGERARAKVEADFALEKIAGRYADLYQELLEK